MAGGLVEVCHVNALVIAIGGVAVVGGGVVCAFLLVLACLVDRLFTQVSHVRVRLLGEVAIVVPVAHDAMLASRAIASVLSASRAFEKLRLLLGRKSL
jgi:hypothetical protein